MYLHLTQLQHALTKSQKIMTNENKYLQARLTLCLFLKSEAVAKGITQQQIADKCGWHQQTVQRMLSGKFSPSLDNFIKLADAILTDEY